MANKRNAIKDTLIEQCLAHDYLEQEFKDCEDNNKGSNIVLKIYKSNIRELEGKITSNTKKLLGLNKDRENPKPETEG